jgi:hypothetical protein
MEMAVEAETGGAEGGKAETRERIRKKGVSAREEMKAGRTGGGAMTAMVGREGGSSEGGGGGVAGSTLPVKEARRDSREESCADSGSLDSSSSFKNTKSWVPALSLTPKAADSFWFARHFLASSGRVDAVLVRSALPEDVTMPRWSTLISMSAGGSGEGGVEGEPVNMRSSSVFLHTMRVTDAPCLFT